MPIYTKSALHWSPAKARAKTLYTHHHHHHMRTFLKSTLSQESKFEASVK